MLVATFGPGSSCAGRTITFADEQFVHEVLGPISAAEVMDYDPKGWPEWHDWGLRRIAWNGRAPCSCPAPLSPIALRVTHARSRGVGLSERNRASG